LRVLASFFERHHGVDLSQSAIFERINLFDALAAAGKVSFAIGLRSQNDDRTNSLRLWDLRSMTVITEEVYRTGRKVELDWCFMEPSQTDALNEDTKRRNLISIGSPQANIATEILLARMFGVSPFKPDANQGTSVIPFRFVWPGLVQSSFAIPVTSLKLGKNDPTVVALTEGKASALVINERVYSVLNDYESATIPGVVVAQRLSDQTITVAIAGLSGPATFGAANLLRDMAPDFQSAPGQSSTIWAAVEVDVITNPGIMGDSRVPQNWRFLTQPAVWKPNGLTATRNKR